MKNFKRLFALLTVLLLILVSCNMPLSKGTADEELSITEGVEAKFYGENVRSGYFMGQKIYYEVIDGLNIFQGDIILSDEQISSEPGRGVGKQFDRWPNNTVYYLIDANYPQAARNIITEAIAHWEARTPLNFVVRTNQANYIRFFRDWRDVSYSSVGMVGGSQNLSLASWADTGTAIHEIGHAIGLFHEQSRTDRDQYIVINWANIIDAKEHNFETFADSGIAGFNYGPFDFGSIMIYPSVITDPLFVHDANIPVITKLDGSTYDAQRDNLSATDIFTGNYMYPGFSKTYFPAGSIYQDELRADPGANLIPGDYNGDGRTDFIRQEKNGWDDDSTNTFSLYFSNGNGTFNKVTPAGSSYQTELKGDNGCNLIPGDYNNDGKTDFIRQEKNGWDDDSTNTFSVYFSNGDGSFNKVTPAGSSYQTELKGDNGCNLIPGDYNGDGRTDFIRQEKNGWDDDSTNTFSVYFSNGDGSFNKVTPAGSSYQTELKGDNGCNLIPGDYNNDGKTDFIRQEKNSWDHDEVNTFSVYFSNGDGSFNKVTPTGSFYQYELKGDNGCNLIPGDFNDDGRTDFIRQEKNGWDDDTTNSFSVYYSSGNGYFTKETPEGVIYQDYLRADPGCNIIPGDFDGDGKSDFIRQERGSNDNDTEVSFTVYMTE